MIIIFLGQLTSLGVMLSRPSMLQKSALFYSLYGWVMSHCRYVAHLYPLTSQPTLGDLGLGRCAYYCTVRWGACIMLNYSFFPRYMPGTAASYSKPTFSIFKEVSILFSIMATPVYPPINSVGIDGRSFFSTFFPALIICRLFADGHCDWNEMIPQALWVYVRSCSSHH